MDKTANYMYNVPMKYKLIGLDLDGTLLRSDKSLEKSTIKLLEELSKKGIHIVPITGRPLSGVPQAVREIDGVDYIISNNGSKTVDNKTGADIFSLAMTNEQSCEVITQVKKTGAMFEVFTNHFGYCEKSVFEHYKDEFAGTVVGDYIFSSRKKIDSIDALFDNTSNEADEVFIICKDEADRERIKKHTDKISDIQYCMLADRFLEITKAGTDKGTALQMLCKHLGIDLNEVIAFGDGENDLQFLQKAGTAVAMGNAVDCVKEMADIITDTNDNNGVEKALKDLIGD